MPHVVLKIASGKPEEKKRAVADAIVRDVVEILGVSEGAVSLAIEETPLSDWTDKVYRPEIEPILDTLYKKPGYRD